MPQRRERTPYSRIDRFDNDMRVFLQMAYRSFRLIEDATVDPPSIRVVVSPSLAMMDLCSLTTEELDAFERFIQTAIETARPICNKLDDDAEQAREAGDGSFQRLYRPRPTYTVINK